MYTMYLSTQHLNQHGGYQVYTISTSCHRTVQSIPTCYYNNAGQNLHDWTAVYT